MTNYTIYLTLNHMSALIVSSVREKLIKFLEKNQFVLRCQLPVGTDYCGYNTECENTVSTVFETCRVWLGLYGLVSDQRKQFLFYLSISQFLTYLKLGLTWVQSGLQRCGQVTSGLNSPPKNSSMWLKEGCCTKCNICRSLD